MSDQSTKSRDEIIKEAQDRWFDADFSWERLREFDVDENQSLQAYWRIDPETGQIRSDDDLIATGELVCVEGQKPYHLAHLPMQYRDGTPTDKTKNREVVRKKLKDIIKLRLISPVQNLDKEGNKIRCNLVGVVFLGFQKKEFVEKIDAYFGHNIFVEQADFSELEFVGDAVFHESIFLGHVNFDGAVFRDDTYFQDVTFSSHAHFEKVKFSNTANWEGTIFLDLAIFEYATFLGESQFKDVAFHRRAMFDNATFQKEVHFDSAVFHGEAKFDNATFYGGVFFDRVPFYSYVFFDNAKFISAMSFRAARFHVLAGFRKIEWPSNVTHYNRAFAMADFEEFADFEGAGFKAFAAFDGARFEKGVKLDKVAVEKAKDQFNHELRDISKNRPVSEEAFQGELDQNTPEKNLESLESGCRVLKQEMEKASDKNREQLFYTFELKARREQKNTPRGEKIFSRIYEFTSDFGASLLRPILWIFLILFPAFSMIYWPFGSRPDFIRWNAPHEITERFIWASQDWDKRQSKIRSVFVETNYVPYIDLEGAVKTAGEITTVSLSRIFPFGAFEDVSKNFAERLERQNRPFSALAFRLLGTLESSLALTLAFLFGLAVRRRFQIN